MSDLLAVLEQRDRVGNVLARRRHGGQFPVTERKPAIPGRGMISYGNK